MPGGIMRLGATVRAVAFVLNAAVFAVGAGRAQGWLAPPDYVYLALLFLTPSASALAIGLGYRWSPDQEILATARIAAYILNFLLFLFVLGLASRLRPEILGEQALWIAILLAAPLANLGALLPDWRARARRPDETGTR